MPRVASWFVLAGAMMLTIAASGLAQQQTTTSETKMFDVIAVNGNDLVVKLPEGTRELTVPDDFRFTVDGQQVSVHELKPGMKGTATITTKTTEHPVIVTEVKNGKVVKVTGSSIVVQTDQGYKAFTQGELEKRGVGITRDGKPVQISDFHTGDMLTATFVTTKPPRVVTEREVAATAAHPATPAAGAPIASTPAPTHQPAPVGTEGTAAESHQLPKTGSSKPLLGVCGVIFLILGGALTGRRRGVV
jgi:LPXTG-motif cell wall-anchored protein